MSDVYRLVYTSRNLLGGRDDEQAAVVAEILATSKRNNARVGVTGALLFNAGSFAQVLEGPRGAVEGTFERIQRDPRHSDVSVLQCEPVAARGFPNWSMAFIGQSARGRALWGEIARRTDFNLGRIEGEQLFATLMAIVKEEEGGADEAPAAPPARPEPATPKSDAKAEARSEVKSEVKSEALDVDRLRAALQMQMQRPEQPSAGAMDVVRPAEKVAPRPPVAAAGRAAEASGEAGIAVLRAALEDERERITGLRRQLDDARVALAGAEGEIETLRRQCDIWTDRTTGLRASLTEARADLAARSDEAGALRTRLAAAEAEVDALRRHRDTWAERARALAAIMCREPGSAGPEAEPAPQDHASAERGTKPSLVRTGG